MEQYNPKPLIVPSWYLKKPQNMSNIAPSISIVTPSLNQGEFIERTIRSVLDQNYPRLEYIVQDGGSIDDTTNILNSFQGELTYFESNQDNGQAHAINLGFQHTDSEIMAFLNADDVFLPGTLTYIAEYFTHHPEVDVVYGHRVIINEQDQEVGRWVLPPHDEEFILWRDYIPQETMFWRRRIWEKVDGHMDESYHFALDWDLILRFQAAGAKFRRLPRFLTAFRTHASQKSTTQFNTLGMEEMTRLLRRVHGRDVGRAEILKNVQPYLRNSLVFHLFYRLGLFCY